MMCFTDLLAKQYLKGETPLKTAAHQVWLQKNEKCHEPFLVLFGLKNDL